MDSIIKPFLLRAVGKDYLWGGDKLNEKYGKNIRLHPLAETWECSTHPDGVSIIDGGEFDKIPLDIHIKNHPEILGEKYTSLPVLVKLIDAKKDLSVQVHPNDEFAKRFENQPNGKNEMWYIVDAEEDASIIYSFKDETDKQILKSAVENGTLEKYLNRIPVKKGDSFFVEAGTIHAIGAGCLIAEIQQSSNLTYRLFDYNRTDKNGNKRELHIDKALACAGTGKPKGYDFGNHICRCDYFCVDLIGNAEFTVDEKSFEILLCTDGNAEVISNFGSMKIKAGQTVFLPSGCGNIKTKGDAELLKIRA